MSSCLPSFRDDGAAFSRSRLRINKQRNSYAQLENKWCLGCAMGINGRDAPLGEGTYSRSLARPANQSKKRDSDCRRIDHAWKSSQKNTKKNQILDKRVHFSACKNCTYLHIVAIAIKYCILCLSLCANR